MMTYFVRNLVFCKVCPLIGLSHPKLEFLTLSSCSHLFLEWQVPSPAIHISQYASSSSQPVVLGAVKMLLLLLLPFSALAYSPDQDLVGDIFGTQQVQETLGEQRSIQQETRCDDLRPCVECSVFRQYWKHFSSAYECYESCKQYSFVYQPGETG